jgi:predicted RNA-binding protein YlqC (UPF0109 family)
MDHNIPVNSSEAPERIRWILEIVIKELVDQPDKVNVNQVVSQGGNTLVFTIQTAMGEAGKVIGRQGRCVQALRLIVESMAAKHKRRVVLEIADSNKQRKVRRNNGNEKLGAY